MNEGANGQVSAESAAMNAARALLQEEEDMQAVHSAKSVAALLKTAKDKIAQVKAAVNPAPPPPSEPKILNEVSIVAVVWSWNGLSLFDNLSADVCFLLGLTFLFSPSTVQPIIIVHDASEGSRLEVKNALSKLPYMNRNPAV